MFTAHITCMCIYIHMGRGRRPVHLPSISRLVVVVAEGMCLCVVQKL